MSNTPPFDRNSHCAFTMRDVAGRGERKRARGSAGDNFPLGFRERFSFITLTGVFQELERGNLLLQSFCRQSMNCERLLTPGPNKAALPVSLSLSSIVPRGPGMSQPALKAKPFRVYETRLQLWNWPVILLLCALSLVTSHAPSSLLKCHILTLLLCMNFHILLLFNNASKIFKLPSNPLMLYEKFLAMVK